MIRAAGGALEGLRVIEIANEIFGPYCGKLFVDLGADVTKIEGPEGDSLRRWGPFPGGVPDPDRSGLFEYLNAGKRAAVLDVARELIADADVLIDGLAPGNLDSSGLGIDALQALNPRLVVVRISNFGQHGPFRDRVATQLTLQAASGRVFDERDRSAARRQPAAWLLPGRLPGHRRRCLGGAVGARRLRLVCARRRNGSARASRR